MKRHFSFIVMLLLTVASLAQTFEVDGIKYNVTSTDELTIEVTSDGSYSGVITIPEKVEYEGNSYSVTSIGEGAFIGCSGLTSITIPNSVTSIEGYAFAGCSGLTSITIPNSVTSIGGSAFSGCGGLTSITIPNSVTSIGAWAFFGCSGLNSITIPNSVTSIGDGAFLCCFGLTSITIPNSVTSIGDSAFGDCSGLTSITIPNSVTSIEGYAFDGCSGLTSITIPNSVTSIGGCAFYNCSGLTSITIPNSVTSIGDGAFSGCGGLTSITIEDGVTSIGARVFKGCSGLTSVNIPNSVTSIGWYAFEGCSSLTSITIPNSVTSIGDGAFSGCGGLTSITIEDGVTSIGARVFEGCSGLTSITFPNSVKDIGGGAFSGCSSLASIVVENGNSVYDSRNECNAIIRTADNELIVGIKNTVIPNSVTSIGDGAFQNCSGLTSVNIPNSVTSIGRYAFEGCSGLTSITIPNSVMSIGDLTFRGCSGLTSIVVESGNAVYDSREHCNAIIRTSDNKIIVGCKNTVIPNSVTNIGDFAFEGCSGLTSITIPNSVTNIGGGAFSGCSGLTSITIPNSVTSIGGGAFQNCSGLTSITIPNSVTSIEESSFFGCSGLTSITIPNSVTSIGDWAFDGCSGLTSITFHCAAVEFWFHDNTSIREVFFGDEVTSIGEHAFEGCSGLTSITIPNSVTSIGDGAFRDCRGLTSIIIPNSVTSIGPCAFPNCSGLTSVIVEWETPLEIDGYVFEGSNYNNAILYVPKGTKAAYEAANLWQDFGTIEEYDKEFDRPQDDVEQTEVSALDNVIYMEPFEATKGKEVDVPLLMKNTAGIRGFQFDMHLPIGVTVAKNENGRLVATLNNKRLPEGSAHTLTVNELEDGTVRFLCGSQYDETLTGTEGEIITVRLCVDRYMLDGQYPIVLKNVKLTETNISKYYLTETVQTALTVIPYTPGDISGDGEIDVSDYIGVANYIMGNTPEGFVAAAADVNKDQVVDVSDYIGIANLILYNSVYGNTNASRRAQRRGVTDVSLLDNVIYLEPFAAEPGGEVQLKLKMKNTAAIRGFQFDLYLPEGMTAKKYANGRIVSSLNDDRRPDGDEHTLTLSERPDGAIRFLCGSQFDETFTGSDGEIATLTINVSADMEEADYPVCLRHVKLTETDISKYYLTEEIETTAMVMNSPWLPGDATEDGDVNVTDIMAVANWILKIKMDKFNLLAADVNGDGDINVTDIMGIANIILKVTPSSNSRATSVADAVEPQ